MKRIIKCISVVSTLLSVGSFIPVSAEGYWVDGWWDDKTQTWHDPYYQEYSGWEDETQTWHDVSEYNNPTPAEETWVESQQEWVEPTQTWQEPQVAQPNDGWWAMGSAGAIKIGSYQAALEWGDLWSNMQSVLDQPGVAGYSYTGAGAEYIADHNGHGMEQTLYNNEMQIKRPDGTVETLYKTSSHFASAGVNSAWVSDDGFENYYGADGRVLTQVCQNGGIWFIYWN